MTGSGGSGSQIAREKSYSIPDGCDALVWPTDGMTRLKRPTSQTYP